MMMDIINVPADLDRHARDAIAKYQARKLIDQVRDSLPEPDLDPAFRLARKCGKSKKALARTARKIGPLIPGRPIGAWWDPKTGATFDFICLSWGSRPYHEPGGKVTWRTSSMSLSTGSTATAARLSLLPCGALTHSSGSLSARLIQSRSTGSWA